ncbi:MAG: hypothetical protein QOE67_257 [Solirubrobacteraceae bacterium]|nr:hypothetical protein [Solirubrobacteraceae bacterium]
MDQDLARTLDELERKIGELERTLGSAVVAGASGSGSTASSISLLVGAGSAHAAEGVLSSRRRSSCEPPPPSLVPPRTRSSSRSLRSSSPSVSAISLSTSAKRSGHGAERPEAPTGPVSEAGSRAARRRTAASADRATGELQAPTDAPPRTSTAIAAASVGVRPTRTPLASSACAFAAAVPDEPETIAPAWPICLPAGAVKPAM